MSTLPTPSTPLNAGALLQGALDVYRRHAATVLWCVVIVMTPLVIISGAVAAALGPGGTRTYDLGSALMSVVPALGGLVAVAACMFVAIRDRAGEPVSVGSALGFGLRRYPQVLAVTLVVALAVFAGTIACILPGIYLLVRWVMAVPALLVEGLPIGDALNRGWKLVDNRWWLTFGLVLLGYLVPGVIAAVVHAIVVALFGIGVETNSPEGLVGPGFAQVIGSAISLPFSAAFLVLLFGDLVATQPATAQQRADWPPPAPVTGPYGPPATGPAAPSAPPAPPAPRAPIPLPEGFEAPRPADPTPGADLAPPPERPPGAGD